MNTEDGKSINLSDKCGIKTNRDEVVARIKVTAGDLTFYYQVPIGRGYQNHYGTRLHLGLGAREKVDNLEVLLIDGIVDVLKTSMSTGS